MLPTILVPRSVGGLEIVSADPAVRPRIDPKYLENAEDMEILKRAIKICLKAAEAEPLRSKIKKLHWHPALLEKHNGDTSSDAFLEDHIRSNVIQVYHQTSTVRMGVDPEAPLDLRCRFKGIEGLRVIDASSFPDLVSGNTNAPVIAFAERAAELIKEDWKD